MASKRIRTSSVLNVEKPVWECRCQAGMGTLCFVCRVIAQMRMLAAEVDKYGNEYAPRLRTLAAAMESESKGVKVL